MTMSASDAVDLVKVYHPQWTKNHEAMSRVDRWYRGNLAEGDKPSMPNQPTREYRELRDRSMTQWLKLAVTIVAQAMYVEGYRRSDEPDNADAWAVWQANQFDSRQIAVHRGALSLGQAYVTVLPGVAGHDTPMPVMRGHSAQSMLALWQDPAEDEWPMYALAARVIRGADGQQARRWRLYDDTAIYTIDSDLSGTKFTFVTFDEHDAQVCPVVRFANMLDLDGRADGEVEPYIDMAARIDQDTFDRLVVQRFGAWLVRYATGLVKPDTDEDTRAQKLKLRVEDILVSDSTDTKFGTLPATPLEGFIRARDADIKDFAACTQTPPQDLLGEMVNISAEALAAAEAGKTRKVEERKHTFGESHEQVLRLAAHLSGDPDGASDFAAQVVWADMESRSLAQAADALGKMATLLGVPPEALWERIPGVTMTDVERWKALAAQSGSLEQLMATLAAGQTSVDDGFDT